MIKGDCLNCDMEFYFYPSRIKYGGGKYCSSSCSKIGKNNPQWKGLNVGYVSIHEWMYRHFGRPTQCEKCGKDNLTEKFINWANISGKYKRDRKDWIRLCKSCHVNFDNTINRGWVTRRKKYGESGRGVALF